MNYGLRALRSKVQGQSTLSGAVVAVPVVIVGALAGEFLTGNFLGGLFADKGSAADIKANRTDFYIEVAVAAGLVGAGSALGGFRTAGFGRGLGIVGAALGAHAAYQYTQFKAAGRI